MRGRELVHGRRWARLPELGADPAKEEQGREKLVRALDSRGNDLLAGGRRRGSRLEFSGRHGSELAHAMAGRRRRAPARWLLRVGEEGREKEVAARKNAGVGVKICQVSTPIYRSSPRVRVSLVGQMGWLGLAQTRNRAALNLFSGIKCSRGSRLCKNRASWSSDEQKIERLIRPRV
jgi:hypothetical protein